MSWRAHFGLVLAALAIPIASFARPAVAATVRSGSPAFVTSTSNDFPDPFVLSAGGKYYAYSTNVGSVHVPTLVSTDLLHWRALGDALPRLSNWARSSNQTWAPAVRRIGRRFLMYLSVWDHRRGEHCVAVAVAKSPGGPFTLNTAPLVCGTGAIDANPLRAADGAQWLIWKFEASGAQPTRIVSQRLASDGERLVGTSSELVRPTLTWEDGVVEGPSMIYHDGTYLLFYSASDWASDHYRTGLALCTSPQGPCVKSSEPYLASISGRVSPGGLTAFITHERLYVAFHVWRGGVGYPRGRRVLEVAQVHFDEGVVQLASLRR